MKSNAKKEATNEEAKAKNAENKFDPKAVAVAALKGTGITMLDILEDVKETISKETGISLSMVTDKMTHATIHSMIRSGDLDGVLRDHGIVPTPGMISAIIGWHDIEHLRARGAANKIAGIRGVVNAAGFVGLGVAAVLQGRG